MIREIYLRNKYKLLLSIVTSVMNSLLTLYVISQITAAISDINGLSTNGDAVMILVAIGCLFALNFTAAVVLSDLNTSTISTLRTSLIHKMLSIDFIKKETLGVDKFYAALTLDIGKLSQFVCQIPVLLYNLVVVILCLGYLFFLSWQMSAILLLSLALLFAVYFFAANKGYLSYIKLRDIEDKLFASFDIMMSGGKELSINQNRKAHYFHQQAVPAAQNLKAAEHKAMHYWIFAESWMMAALFVCLFAIVFFGRTVLQMDGEQLVQIAMIFLFVLLPMKALSQGFGALSQAKVSLDKIASLELMQQSDSQDERVFERVDKASDLASLSLDKVCFEYPSIDAEHNFHFGPVSIDLTAGNIVFVVGGNGSGKTTLIKLLLGLLRHSSGDILLNGDKLNDENLDWYRQHFSCVFQDFFLFNEVLSSSGAAPCDDEINHLIGRLGLNDKVTTALGQLSTTKLSQGQKRRLAMIIALHEDSPIYVFDEWAADQDAEFKAYFYRQLLPELKAKGKLVVAVTHDEKYYGDCDSIIKLEQGRQLDE